LLTQRKFVYAAQVCISNVPRFVAVRVSLWSLKWTGTLLKQTLKKEAQESVPNLRNLRGKSGICTPILNSPALKGICTPNGSSGSQVK